MKTKKDTRKIINKVKTMCIGDHVWIGRDVVLLKKAKVGNDCIIGTRAVVTKEMLENNVMIAGNPATIKRRNVYWVKSYNDFTKDDHEYRENYKKYIHKLGESSNLQ